MSSTDPAQYAQYTDAFEPFDPSQMPRESEFFTYTLNPALVKRGGYRLDVHPRITHIETKHGVVYIKARASKQWLCTSNRSIKTNEAMVTLIEAGAYSKTDIEAWRKFHQID